LYLSLIILISLSGVPLYSVVLALIPYDRLS
jgi:hypothetical protein